jgi:hypothetical protein
MINSNKNNGKPANPSSRVSQNSGDEQLQVASGLDYRVGSRFDSMPTDQPVRNQELAGEFINLKTDNTRTKNSGYS